MAVSAAEKKDEDKLGELLVRACEEDKTLSYAYNSETKQSVLSGMGDLHITIILNRIKALTKIAIQTAMPRIAYRETIRRKGAGRIYAQKADRGHGQREGCSFDRALGTGENYSFSNAVFGGAISKAIFRESRRA